MQYVLSTTSNEQYTLKGSAAALRLFMIFLGNINGYVLPFSEQSKRRLDVQLKILK